MENRTNSINKNKMIYDTPADSWETGSPLGNGRIGAMVRGNTGKEIIHLNEGTLWSGYPADYTDQTVYEYLPKVREAIFQKRYKDAEEILNKHMTGVWNESYLPMGDFVLTIENLTGQATDYCRTMDIENALSATEFSMDGIHCKRTVFCSFPSQIMAVNVETSAPVDMKLELDSQLKGWMEVNENVLCYHGWCPDTVEPDYYPCDDPIRYSSFEETKAIRFQFGTMVSETDGIVDVNDQRIQVTGARKVTILVGSANSFVGYNHASDGEYVQKLSGILNDASQKTYKELLENHIRDYRELFDRVELDLGHTESEILPMKKRLKAFHVLEDDPELVATAFQFGRYLAIASSRKGSQPPTLQGIWNQILRARWSSNYTMNINIEMNYWPMEVTNLVECTEPLLKFIEECADTGSKTASVNYHCRGWCTHHNVDLWRKTTAVGSRKKEIDVQPWSFWLGGGGWLCRHIWEHYLYTQDQTFLEETALPLMLESACFYLDWMIEKDGVLTTCPSTSPENSFVDGGVKSGVSYGASMDIQIIKELFVNCINAAKVLGKDETEVPVLSDMAQALKKLPGWKVGSFGQLQEWSEDLEEFEPTHRHMSMLYGLYPSDLFGRENNETLNQACKVVLERRGDDSVSWSRAWKTALYARLFEKEKAGAEAEKYLELAEEGAAQTISYTTGGILENLFAARPLQIDGCFGFTAGIAEMLVQDYAGTLNVLPAIPDDWKKGYVRGLRLRNGREIEIRWEGEQKSYSVY